MKTQKIVIAVALAAGLSGAVWAQGMKGHEGMGMQGMDQMMQGMQQMMPSSSDAPGTKAFKEAHLTMMRNMNQEFTGNSDVDFVQGMIPHHQGAIDMAKVQLQYGKDPELRKMAETIISDQEKEIAQMQGWLKQNKK
jgi:uncharacterized protein (DUF305 family)